MNPETNHPRKRISPKPAESRRSIQVTLGHENHTPLQKPEWLSEDALKVWNEVCRQLKDRDLIDNLDAELVAIYCDAVDRYSKASQALMAMSKNDNLQSRDEGIKTAQVWAQIVAEYADILGLPEF